MTNENKNINELVSDEDDQTAELDAQTLRRDFSKAGQAPAAESELSTYELDKRAQDNRTVDHLQFDVEQFRARWLGLEAEIKVREELTNNLNAELKNSEQKLERKEKLLQQRDRKIKSLKVEIRERDSKFRELKDSADELQRAGHDIETGDDVSEANKQISEQAGQLASNDAMVRELQARQQKTEEYADQLRRKLGDVSSDSETALKNAERAHAEEIRVLRFELGEAEDTLAQNEHITEQLASDLIDTRNFRDELEHMLRDKEEKNDTSIMNLRKKVSKLGKTVSDYEEKLESKTEAINCLLAELTKKSQQIDSIEKMEVVIHEIDNHLSKSIDSRPPPDRERVTRLLIGQVDDKELRFPLFKNRLTIGRTRQNDIQLKAQHISRRHAVITTEGDAARVIDWGSKNGVYVNSKRVTEHFLENGDIVAIGSAEFRYEELPKRDA